MPNSFKNIFSSKMSSYYHKDDRKFTCNRCPASKHCFRPRREWRFRDTPVNGRIFLLRKWLRQNNDMGTLLYLISRYHLGEHYRCSMFSDISVWMSKMFENAWAFRNENAIFEFICINVDLALFDSLCQAVSNI